MPRIQDTDAFILREFDEATAPIRELPKGHELTARMGEIGAPFYARLKDNGHTPSEAIALLRATFQHNPKN